MEIKIGDVLTCSNGRNYRIAEGNDQYNYSLLDEIGREVNKTHDYVIDEAIRHGDKLCVGYDHDNKLERVGVLAVNGEPVIDRHYLEESLVTIHYFLQEIASGDYETIESIKEKSNELLREIYFDK